MDSVMESRMDSLMESLMQSLMDSRLASRAAAWRARHGACPAGLAGRFRGWQTRPAWQAWPARRQRGAPFLTQSRPRPDPDLT